MNICIWINGIYKLGGTRRVVTMISNELVKDHNVTIMSYVTPGEEEDRYGLDERVAIDFVESAPFKKDLNYLQIKKQDKVKAKNSKTGCYNKPEKADAYMKALFPDKEVKRWADYINSKDYDVVIAVGGLILRLAGLADHLNAKTIGWIHNCYDSYFNEKGVLYWNQEEIARRYFAKLDRVLVLNKYDKADFDRHLGLNCVIMGNPRSFASEVKTDVHQKQFFAAARFVKQKGLDLLIKSFAEFCQYDDEWTLVIAGDGPARNKLLKEVWKYGLQERVRFIGMTNDVQKYYLESSVYLLSSRWEGWGLVIIEAFEMGMPVISYDIVPVDLLITNGVDGIIVEQFDTVKYAAAMLMLARDEKLRESMAAAAIEKAECYSIEKIGVQWRSLLDELRD